MRFKNCVSMLRSKTENLEFLEKTARPSPVAITITCVKIGPSFLLTLLYFDIRKTSPEGNWCASRNDGSYATIIIKVKFRIL